MERVKKFLHDSGDLKYQVADTLAGEILKAAHTIRDCLSNGGKLLLMGNGGSAADSQHIAAELIGRVKKERKAIPALALTVDSSALTALGNDYGFETIFSRQVEALATPNDAIVGISTSGNSKNVIRALETGNAMGMHTFAILGYSGGICAEIAQVAIHFPIDDMQISEDLQLIVGHMCMQRLRVLSETRTVG